MSKVIFFLIVIISINSCKNNSKENKVINKQDIEQLEKNEKEVVKDDIYRVTITGVFSKKGLISMNYLENSNDKFNSQQYLIKHFEANISEQKITFELPKDVYLENFRIRPLYDDKSHSEIQISEINISINGYNLNIDQTNFFEFFKGNAYVNIEPNNPIITFKTNVINGREIFDPFIIGSDKLVYELQIL